jgi:hypothetical protein
VTFPGANDAPSTWETPGGPQRPPGTSNSKGPTMPHDLPGQRYIFPQPNNPGPIEYDLAEPPKEPSMPQMTAAQQAHLVPLLTKAVNLANRPVADQAKLAADWKSILAQLLEQMGPFFIQLLISILLGEEPSDATDSK